METVIYFGAWERLGHYLYGSDHRLLDPLDFDMPWPIEELDCGLCPGGRTAELQAQVEGAAALHHKRGWTALAFWDRSCDRRPGSCSVFIAKGVQDFEMMRALARVYFSPVWSRFFFKVRLVPQTVTD